MYYLFKNTEYNTYSVSGNHSDLKYAKALDQWELEDIFDDERDANLGKREKEKQEVSECTT